MSGRIGKPILIIALGIACATGAAVWKNRWAGDPVPTLARVRTLARSHQIPQARAMLERYLVAYPADGSARLLMAELATEPLAPEPLQALEHLRAIRPETTRQAAVVKFYEGKAEHQRGRFDLAESAWRDALTLEPTVPEAGWALIDLLDRENRADEAHALGMRLHEIEPDPRDRVRLLLEMSRLDIETPDPLSQILLFEPLVKEHPENLPISLALGRAMIRANRSEEGIRILEGALSRHANSADAWDGWLTGLYQASDADRLIAEFARLPPALGSEPRFAKHEAMIAQLNKNWKAAVDAYRRAFAFEPFNWGVCYRLRFALRQVGDVAEAERMDRLYEQFKLADAEMRGSVHTRFAPEETKDFPAGDHNRAHGAYYETLSVRTLGIAPHAELYQRLAGLREKMGRFDEARAWHRLVMRDSPSNPISLAALERLK
jgi:tetratricopeptide (TPR) repeat protein